MRRCLWLVSLALLFPGIVSAQPRELPAEPVRDTVSLKGLGLPDEAALAPEERAPVNTYAREEAAAPAVPAPEPSQPEVASEAPSPLAALQREYETADTPGDSAAAPARDNASLGRLVLQAVMALGVVCASILILAYLVRKFGRRTPLLAGQEFGRVLGRVYLGPRISLHYVRSADRVLLLGVTQNSVSLLTEFDAETFLAPEAGEATPREGGFLARLHESVSREPEAPPAARGDDDIAALRGDIQRLREHLQERARETRP